jgi:hypothetical protein
VSAREPFPLQWPTGWRRTPEEDRDSARFRVSLAEALQDLLYELDLMNAANVVITSDLPTRSDGLPYSSGKCDDPGIAVWCTIGGQERVFACDRWASPAANIRAIGKTIESLRGIARWGAADMVTRAVAGFQALPAGDGQETAPNPASIRKHWATVLNVPRETSDGRAPTRAQLLNWARVRHREAIRKAHPDAGGSHERATELNVALQEAEAELGG